MTAASSITTHQSPSSSGFTLRHRLVRRDLHEELFQRGAFQFDFAEGPAVLDDGAGDFLADVVAVLRSQGGGDVLVAVAVDHLDVADAAHAVERVLHLPR